MELAPLGRPAVSTEAVPASDTSVIPYGWPTSMARLRATDRSLNELTEDHWRISAAAMVTDVTPVGTGSLQSKGLSEAQINAETNATHPTTAMLLQQMGQDYGRAIWRIVRPNADGSIDHTSEVVSDPWAMKALSMLDSAVEDQGALKERLWWLWAVHGECYVTVAEDYVNSSQPYSTFVWAVDGLEMRRDGNKFGLAVDQYVRAPYGPGADEWFPIVGSSDASGQTRYPIRRLVNSYGRRPGVPFTVLQSLAPFYQLFWSLLRGDLATADSRAIMNGLLWTPSDGFASSTTGEPMSEDAQAIYGMMGLRNTASDPDGLISTIARSTLNNWKYPGRHLSRLPIPYSSKTAPKMIDIGRKFDQNEAMKMEAVELRMARGFEAPAGVFLGSVGEARQNQFNAWQEEDSYVGAIERAGIRLDALMTRAALQPVMEFMGRNPEGFALYSNYDILRPRRDTPENWKWAVRFLGVDRAAAMRGIGLPPDALLEGSAYAEWLATMSPYATRATNKNSTGTNSGGTSGASGAANNSNPDQPSSTNTATIADRVTAAVSLDVSVNANLHVWMIRTPALVEQMVRLVWDESLRLGVEEWNRNAAAVDLDSIMAKVRRKLNGTVSRGFRGAWERLYKIAGAGHAADVTAAVERAMGRVGDRMWRDGSDLLIADVVARALAALSQAQGDANAVKEPSYDVTRAELQSSFGTAWNDSLPIDAALQALGYTELGWQWVYGDDDRIPFQPHLDVDGIEFSSWDDERLQVPAGFEWLGRDYLTISDHVGCRCLATRQILQAG